MPQSSQNLKRTREEINALIMEFRENESEAALVELADQYTPLIASLARKYSKGKNFHEDLMQVGMIGLLVSLKRYDPAYGKSFESFLIPTVIGEMKRFLRDKTWSVHVPRRIKELWPKVKAAVDELTNLNQRSPKIKEIAQFLNISEEEVLEAMEIGKSYQAASVDQSTDSSYDENSRTLLEIIGNPDKGYEKVDQKLLIRDALHVLTKREREIIHCLFIENKSQRETGDQLGISQMHVSRLQKRAIEKLRQELSSHV
ncbi:RNA polymerase sigma factor SigB [Neobacillus fumarioli]|uniref:RNA polymerase sigma factor SigB n=1 Tax=Neobacillus fumarioli TaxID=105229 RepID=UPI00082C422F|nr:RNA polymerase sigma factor SigB [Neobacillus fumarioli]